MNFVFDTFFQKSHVMPTLLLIVIEISMAIIQFEHEMNINSSYHPVIDFFQFNINFITRE